MYTCFIFCMTRPYNFSPDETFGSQIVSGPWVFGCASVGKATHTRHFHRNFIDLELRSLCGRCAKIGTPVSNPILKHGVQLSQMSGQSIFNAGIFRERMEIKTLIWENLVVCVTQVLKPCSILSRDRWQRKFSRYCQPALSSFLNHVTSVFSYFGVSGFRLHTLQQHGAADSHLARWGTIGRPAPDREP